MALVVERSFSPLYKPESASLEETGSGDAILDMSIVNRPFKVVRS